MLTAHNPQQAEGSIMAVQRADWMSDAGFDSAVTAAPAIERELELRALSTRLRDKERLLDELLAHQPEAERVAVRGRWEELQVLWQAWTALWTARRDSDARLAAAIRSGKGLLMVGVLATVAIAFLSTNWASVIAASVAFSLLAQGVLAYRADADRRALTERATWLDVRWHSLCGSESESLERLRTLDARRVASDAASEDTDAWRARSWEIERETRNELVNVRYRALCIYRETTLPYGEWRDTLAGAAITDTFAD